jgi:hypothetical protein
LREFVHDRTILGPESAARGRILLSAFVNANVVRIEPPLGFTETEVGRIRAWRSIGVKDLPAFDFSRTLNDKALRGKPFTPSQRAPQRSVARRSAAWRTRRC